jgi:hypothetical protein
VRRRPGRPPLGGSGGRHRQSREADAVAYSHLLTLLVDWTADRLDQVKVAKVA